MHYKIAICDDSDADRQYPCKSVCLTDNSFGGGKTCPLMELILTIMGFVLGMMLVSAASAYVNANTLYGRISVRSEIVNLLNRKAATASYLNVDDDQFRKLLAKSDKCISSNQAATEAIWTTLTTLAANISLTVSLFVSRVP